MNRGIFWTPALLALTAGILHMSISSRCGGSGTPALLLATGILGADPKMDTLGPDDLELRFLDGSCLRNVAMADKVAVATKFGKLTIETKEIRRIEFGLQMSDEISRKIDNALARLQSDNFKMREAAGKELVALGRYAYPALVKLTKSSDARSRPLVEPLLQQLRDKLSAYQLKMKVDDLIYTGDSVIAGRIQGPLKVRTRQFGEAKLNLSELQSIRSRSGITEAAFAVDGAKYGVNRAVWMETDVTIEAGYKLLITASGQIDMQPTTAGQFVSGPDGAANIGQTEPPYLAGTLIGRIGERGQPFRVGQKFDGPIAQEGKLYLRIVMWGNGVAPSGSFDVKATVSPD
jgi:hypothetical protein